MLPAIAVLLGAGLYALALPPYDCSWLAWLTLVPLLLAVHNQRPAAAFGYGVLYGSSIGWLATGWAFDAVCRYFGVPWWLAIPGLCVFFATVSAPSFGLFAAFASVLQRSAGRLSLLTVPALWVGTELLRGRFVGQPWVLLGYTQHAQPDLIQIASITGVYGVSFLVVLGNVAITQAIVRWRTMGNPASSVRSPLIPAAAALLAVWATGAAIVRSGSGRLTPTNSVAVVQANIAPSHNWTRAFADHLLATHIRATDSLPESARPALIVWPENAIAQYLEGDPSVRGYLSAVARRHDADLLLGAPRLENGRSYNSVRLIHASGRDGGHYDKRRLVVFAEVGLPGTVDSADASDAPTAFTPGLRPGVLQSFVPVGVSICHEIVYPELVAATVDAGAQLLVNVSNDGWIDGGSGVASSQHFAMAVFRAVETRRYLLRSATTGVSGVIDPFGRVVGQVALGTRGTLAVPVAGVDTHTPYVRFGDAFALLCICLVAIHLIALRRPRLSRARLVLAPGN